MIIINGIIPMYIVDEANYPLTTNLWRIGAVVVVHHESILFNSQYQQQQFISIQHPHKMPPLQYKKGKILYMTLLVYI
jgi:hypothetical protein